jgi:DNA-binding SARP family transcriptional activator
MEKDAIYVRTLGAYSVSYKGVEIAIGTRDESQIGLLMLLMFHFGEDGASRSLIRSTLFEDREIEDVSHAIRNVLYNMRKNLKA